MKTLGCRHSRFWLRAIGARRLVPTAIALLSLAIATGVFPVAAAEVKAVGSELILSTGALRQVLGVVPGRVVTKNFTIEGREILTTTGAPPSRCFSLLVSRANPNQRPKGLRRGEAAGSGTYHSEAQRLAGGPSFDDLRPDAVRWEDSVYLTGLGLRERAGKIIHEIHRPEADRVRLDLTIPLVNPVALAGVTLVLRYEVFEGFPVIRKSITVQNRSSHWLRLSRLLIDDIEMGVAFNQPIALTPRGLGVESCLVGFPSFDGRGGVIAGSEVPAGLRGMTEGAALGYASGIFEWVLGPGEDFVSEPVFWFGFTGEVKPALSAVSTPLDRAVEGPLQAFLDRHVILPAQSLPLVAPQWMTWAGFRADVDDAIIRRQAELAARAGFAQLLIDDGWQKDRVGTEVDPKKFPNFAATAAAVRQLGLSFGLWVSDYRTADSPDLREMPDARVEPPVILDPKAEPGSPRPPSYAMSFASPWRDYYVRDLLRLHRDYGVDYFKQDFTALIYGDLAASHEGRTKRDSLLRSIRGLFAAQDALRREAPAIVTELTHEIYWGNPGPGCDLAALAHAVQYHIPVNACAGELPPFGKTPVNLTAAEHRQILIDGCFNVRQRFYGHRGLPLHRLEFWGVSTQNYEGSLTPAVQDRQIVSLLLGAPLTFSGDLRWLTEENVAHYRRRFDLLARLQREYDVYRNFQFSGVPPPTDRDWHWWGKLNPSGLGAVVVLRGRGGAEARAIDIPWVDRDRRYRVTACFAARPLGEFTGAELQDRGVRLRLEEYGQEILELAPAAEDSRAGRGR